LINFSNVISNKYEIYLKKIIGATFNFIIFKYCLMVHDHYIRTFQVA
jgi:hypothetical protein